VNLSRVLLDRAERTPDAAAIEWSGATLTFADLAAWARRGAGFVRSRAAEGDAPVALLLDGDAHFVGWFLAVALAGRPVLPLNLRLTASELAGQLRDARVGMLVADEDDPRLADLARLLPGLTVTPAPDFDALEPATGPWPGESADEDDVLAILFTSGTSGRSKGACLTAANFLASARGAAERLGPCVHGRWLACMPLFHVGGLSIVVRSLLFGGPIRLHARFDAVAVSEALEAGDIAGVSLVPTMLSRLIIHREGRRCPAGLRAVLLGGAAAPPALVERALGLGYPICPTYGLTEATSQVATAAPPAPGARAPGPMRPLEGTELRVLARGRDAAVGEEGEILVRGPTVMRGYLNDAVATARALQSGWLHTGDVGCLDADGGLHVLDRRDDLVVSGGENVYPAEVEAVLLEHPDVVEAGVTGEPDDDLGARVAAWVVLRDAAVPDVAALADHCAGRLAGYKRPRRFHFVQSLPRNASGKLLRRRLSED
jgi:O-succinylbenzoic acid--CoA ligase